MGRKGAVTLSLIIVFIGLLSNQALGSSVWQKVSAGVLESGIDSMHSVDEVVYFASSKSLYLLQAPYKSATQVALLPSGIHQVYQLKVSKNNPDTLFVLTDSGAYTFSITNKNWQKVYEDSKENLRAVYDLLEVGQIVYLATATGLVVSNSDLSVWRKSPQLDHQAVYRLSENNAFLFAVTNQGVYRLGHKSTEWKKIFSMGAYSAEDVEINQDDAVLSKSFIKDVLVLGRESDDLIIATAQGIFQGSNHNFRMINSSGLLYKKVFRLLNLDISSTKHDLSILAASSDGVYVYDGRLWQKIFQGIETDEINDLIMDGNYVWAATAKGIYYLSIKEGVFEVKRLGGHQVTRSPQHQNEPTIAQIQKWAIDYAEVNPDKIKNWRAAVRQKALLPNLSVGLNRDAGEFFHWDTGPSPDVLQKGRDLTDWDVSLSWDLGELVWNNDQTAIDSRSKLMVELRQDILDQLTRLYFERRRLILTLNNSDEDAEEVTLRVQELTALIDGYTGGLFTKEIEGLPRHQVTIPGK